MCRGGWMSEPLRQMTLWPDVGGSTSSLGACPASRRVSRASDRVPRIPGGSGRNTSGWSWISNLSGYLRRTCQVFSRSGNPAPCSLIWKRRVMKCGRSSWVLGRSVPRTSGIGCGLSADEWGTPNSHERTHTARLVHHGKQLANQATWPTCSRLDANGNGPHGDGGLDLRTAVQAAQWPTPAARDWRSDAGQQADQDQYGTRGMPLPRVAWRCAGPPAPASPNMSGSSRDWSTPNVPNGGR